jgi:tetratricopeptide (TPR) repeat protein
MDAGLLWTVVGSAAGVLAAILTAWQVRLQFRDRRGQAIAELSARPSSGGVVGALPVAAPLGRLPAEIRGRDALLDEFRGLLARRGRKFPVMARRHGRTWVLAGMGGLGKSTLALAAAQSARSRGWRVWWVNASDAGSLAGGMLEILQQLRAPEAVTEAVREGAMTAADRSWVFLNGPHIAGRRWLLIFDNADSPRVLAAPGSDSPADHSGWLRPDPLGVVIVTSRNKDPHVWGPGVMLREIVPLGDAAAAKVLADLAPAISDPDGSQALDLARRLGGLPLALHLAGSYLASPFARWRTFAEYRQALDSVELPAALADTDAQSGDTRSTIQRTWDLSLDALAADGKPQARPLLLLLSCYAPATPIPAALLDSIGRLPGEHREESGAEPARVLLSGIRGLAAAGLIDVAGAGVGAAMAGVTVHPVVADANRARLATTDQASLPLVGETAVRRLRSAAAALDPANPADWRAWNTLVPHVLSLVQWLAVKLPDSVVADLLGVSRVAISALLGSGSYGMAELLARASLAAGTRLGEDHAVNLAARHCLATALEGLGRNAASSAMFGDVLADRQRVLGNDHPDTLATRYELAQVVAHTRYAEAERMYRDVLTDQERVLGGDDPRTLATRYALGRVLGRQRRNDQAEQIFRQVLATQQRVLGSNHPDTLNTRRMIPWAMSRQGRYAEAEREYREVLNDQSGVLGDYHPDVLRTRRGLARTLAFQGHSEHAVELFRQVLTDQQRIVGHDHPSTLFTQAYLADAVIAQRRYPEAERLYRDVLSHWQEGSQGDNPLTLVMVSGLARVVALQGRHAEAEELFRRAFTGHQQLMGSDHPDTLDNGSMLALALASQGKHEQAEQLLHRVLSARERVLGPAHPDTQATRQELDRITKLQGRPVNDMGL